MSEKMPSRRRYITAVILTVVGTLAGWTAEGWMMTTTTPSLKHRLYFREKAAPKVVHKGDYISFNLHDPLINGGKKFIATKKAACVAGETLRVEGQYYYCGTEYLGFGRDHLRDGRALHRFIYNGPIPKGHFFAFGDGSPDSYDSRYWGFVSIDQTVDRVHPIL